MTLRIHKSANEEVVIFALSGRIDVDQLTELERLLRSEADAHRIVVDLKEVRLVSREAVRFLARCEGDGIQLENCPAYVRAWIEGENSTAQRVQAAQQEVTDGVPDRESVQRKARRDVP